FFGLSFSWFWGACCDQLPDAFLGYPLNKSRDHENLLGVTIGFPYGIALALVIVIYSAKFLLGRVRARWLRAYWFALLVLASLPCIWLLVVEDWHNRHVYRISCWVYDSIGIWFIPTISFAADTISLRSPKLLWYLGRSFCELALMVLWMH